MSTSAFFFHICDLFFTSHFFNAFAKLIAQHSVIYGKIAFNPAPLRRYLYSSCCMTICDIVFQSDYFFQCVPHNCVQALYIRASGVSPFDIHVGIQYFLFVCRFVFEKAADLFFEVITDRIHNLLYFPAKLK